MTDVDLIYQEISKIIKSLMLQDKAINKRIDRIEEALLKLIDEEGFGKIGVQVGSETGIEDTKTYNS